MPTSTWLRPTSALLGTLLTLTACAEEPPPAPRPRPVAVVELQKTDPIKPLQISGSVRSWKEQDVAFEVSGRVEFIVDETTYLEGRWMKDGKVVEPGGVLARIDPREYEIARSTAQASVAVAEQNVKLAQVELNEVLPASVQAAEANRDRAQAEYIRIKKARESGAVAEIDLIRSTADRDEGIATVAKTLADIEAKRAEIESLQATVAQAKEQVAQADYDLERCTLYAPLTGEVASINIEAGGYAQAGEPVAHLVMMDPIKVDLSLSAETAKRIKEGDRVRVYPLGSKAPLVAWVYQISTVADAATRTFRVSLMCRNEWTYGGFPAGSEILDLPRVSLYTRMIPMRAGDPSSPMAVEARRSLQHDAKSGEWYVWASDDISAGKSLDRTNPVVTVRRVVVVPGDARRNFQGLFELRSLTDAGDLTAKSMVLMDPPEGLKHGDRVLVAPKAWRLRAGQIVHVLLADRQPAEGLYVPLNVIIPTNEGAGFIFVEQDGLAREIAVNLVETAGELVRIEASDEVTAELLVPGARIISQRIHYLEDGDQVRVVKNEEFAR